MVTEYHQVIVSVSFYKEKVTITKYFLSCYTYFNNLDSNEHQNWSRGDSRLGIVTK